MILVRPCRALLPRGAALGCGWQAVVKRESILKQSSVDSQEINTACGKGAHFKTCLGVLPTLSASVQKVQTNLK